MAFEDDVRLILSAEDRASEEVQAAAKRINDEYHKMENVNKAVSRSTILNNRELFATARVLNSIGAVANRVMGVYTQYNIMQIRLAETAENVAEAEEDMRRAILENGPGSEEAIQASRRLRDAQEAQTRATQESQFAMIGFGLSLATSAGSVINAIPRIQQLAAALRGLGAANTAFAFSGALANAGTFAGAAGAGAAAGAANKAGASSMLARFGPYGAAAAAGLISYEYFSQPGDQTGLVDANDPNALGSQINDAVANFLNFFSEGVGIGKIAGTTADLKNEININIYGQDPRAISDEVAREIQMVRVGR